MQKTINYIHALLHMYAARRCVFWGLLSVCVLSIGMYMVFVTSIAFYAGEHKHFSREVAEVQTHVSTLETRYMELSEDIDVSYAYQNGYEETQEVTYVRRGALARNADEQNDI